MTRTPEDIQDELLVFRCQDGDEDAFKELIGRWQPRLGRFALRLTGEREAARDIVQDAWLFIVRRLRRLDDPARFRSWAYRVVGNKCADWTRRHVVQRRVTKELQSSATDCHDPSKERNAENNVTRIRDALRRLPDDQRAILSLHYLDGMRDIVMWAAVCISCISAVSVLKIWYFLEINRNAVTREIKRLELQIARLAGRLKDQAGPCSPGASGSRLLNQQS